MLCNELVNRVLHSCAKGSRIDRMTQVHAADLGNKQRMNLALPSPCVISRFFSGENRFAGRWSQSTGCSGGIVGSPRLYRTEIGMTVQLQAFTLKVPDDAITDLRERLSRTRYPDQAPGAPRAYGT